MTSLKKVMFDNNLFYIYLIIIQLYTCAKVEILTFRIFKI